jgi:hypothetical protein
MTLGRQRTMFGITVAAIVCLLGVVSAANQAGPEPAPQMSEEFFTNIQVLKGIPVDEFMDTMGMFSASLGYDCVSCHSPEIYTNRAEAFGIATPTIQRARQMVVMMNTINRTFFGGEPRMSCFTCHRGQDRPGNIPSLELQYGNVIFDPSEMEIFPDTRTTVDAVFDTYLEALGGAEQLASLTSFVATGTYGGFNTGGDMLPVEIFAKGPDQRAQVVHTLEGDATKTYDGRESWVSEGWRPMPLMPFTGGNLEGARLEALVSFPAGLRAAFAEWQVSGTSIGDRQVRILQGTNPDELPVNFYFDDAGLLTRIVRWNDTAVGTVPLQVDYEDYREVAGVMMPFRTVMTWTDGRSTFELKEIQPNVEVPAARFARPAPYERVPFTGR